MNCASLLGCECLVQLARPGLLCRSDEHSRGPIFPAQADRVDRVTAEEHLIIVRVVFIKYFVFIDSIASAPCRGTSRQSQQQHVFPHTCSKHRGGGNRFVWYSEFSTYQKHSPPVSILFCSETVSRNRFPGVRRTHLLGAVEVRGAADVTKVGVDKNRPGKKVRWKAVMCTHGKRPP